MQYLQRYGEHCIKERIRQINEHTEGIEAEKQTDKHTERHDSEAKSRACMRQNDSS